MLILIVNIIAGFMLAAPMLKKLGGAQEIEKAQSGLNNFRGVIGIIALVLGVIALIQRLGIVWMYTGLYDSFPQAIIAIIMGLMLAANFFQKYASVHNFIQSLEKYSEWIGVLGIIIGLSGIF